eukprot:1510373-Rhodomonas_salina.1
MNRGSHVEGERQTKPRTGQTRGDYCWWVTTAMLVAGSTLEESRGELAQCGGHCVQTMCNEVSLGSQMGKAEAHEDGISAKASQR